MVRAAADSIYEELLNAFPPQRARTADDFCRPPMPDALCTFLRNELRQSVEKDLALPSSEWVDFEEGEVAEAWEAFRAAALEHARIPPNQWPATLKEAVFLVTRYLAAPATTLCDVVFRDGASNLPTGEIRRRMAFFDGYPYFRDIVEGYFERKEVSSTTRESFRDLVHRVDRKMVEQYDTDDWAKLLRPLYELCRVLREESQPAVPAGLLMVFFDEKQRGEVARRIAREQGRGLEFVDETNLRRILDETTYAASPPREERPLERRPAETGREAAERRPAAQPASKRPGEPVPLWMKFAEERSKARASEPAGGAPDQRRTQPPAFEPSGDGDTGDRPMWAGVRPADVREEKRPAERPDAAHFRQEQTREEPGRASPQPLWMRFAKSRPEKPQAPAPPKPGTHPVDALEQTVLGPTTPEQRRQYVDHLFNGSIGDYEDVLGRLEGASSWAEASQIIGLAVFQKHQVNIYSEPAVAFTDAVESRYSR